MNKKLPLQQRILLVEDDEDLCEAARIGLERQGYQVEGFRDPLAARAAFAQSPQDWDLVITDQNMPALTGLQLIRDIKAARDDIPVILWTGLGHMLAAETARAEGAALYLDKPVENGALAQAVRKLLRD